MQLKLPLSFENQPQEPMIVRTQGEAQVKIR